MKYFLICDFSTLSCNRQTVANILTENEISFINHNNFCWELDVPNETGNPFTEIIAEFIRCLFLKYCDKDSFLLVVKADEYCFHLDDQQTS